MATYKVSITNIATDGTNIFVDLSVTDGEHTMPPLRPVFPVGTPAADITAYAQAIADNRPVLAGAIADLVNTTVTGA